MCLVSFHHMYTFLTNGFSKREEREEKEVTGKGRAVGREEKTDFLLKIIQVFFLLDFPLYPHHTFRCNHNKA